MIKTSYHFVHRTTIALTLLLFALTLIFTNKYTLVFLAEKFLKENNVSYTKVKGTLFHGVILYDVAYKDLFRAKKIQLNYKLISFIKLKPIIKNIETSDLLVNIDRLPPGGAKADFKLIPFKILNINLHKSKLIIHNKSYLFDLKVKNLVYDNSFHTNDVAIKLKSYYANADIRAKISNNRVIAQSSDVVLTRTIEQKYLNFIKKIPNKLKVYLYLDMKKITLQTHINEIELRANENVKVLDQELQINYFIKSNDFSMKDNYLVDYQNYVCKVSQTGRFDLEGKYKSKLRVTMANPPSAMPVRVFDADLSGNTTHMSIDANSSGYILNAVTKDYNKFKIKLKNRAMQLSTIASLPKKVRKNIFAFDSYSSFQFSPFSIESVFNAKNRLGSLNGTLHYSDNYKQLTAEIVPDKHTTIYNNYKLKYFSPFAFKYIQKADKASIDIKANLLQIFAKREKKRLDGYGNFASAIFSLNGITRDKLHTDIKLYTDIPSINTFLSDLNLSTSKNQTRYNGVVNINSNIHIAKDFSIHSTIEAPFLSAQTNSQNKYILKDVSLHTSYKNKKIHIYNYQAFYKEQKFFSDTPSTLHLDTNETIWVDSFYVYDNLILKGAIKPFESRMQLNLHSDKFHFSSNDMNLNAKTNINIEVENTKRQLIDGNITLLGGSVSYMPQQDYTISDEDIIIVQDMKRNANSNLKLNININATKPIKYKTKKIDVKFKPLITLKKEPAKKLKVYGKIIILSGDIQTQGKVFNFDRSEFIFSGQKHLNPQLALKLHYQTIDYKDIVILVTNTLNAPMFIFSSDPAMSQNDIMSYILFDEPADNLFDNSTEASKTSINYLLLGTGIKTIFNQTTGIHVDTLNILNNKNGTLGYEVGARFNKKIRIVYKNDTSSSMIVQYNLVKSLRVDVDVHDTGQGVYFIYTKDFKGF